jgi:diacylglycerol kinase family enzyme
VTNASRIPAFVNPESGTAEKARDALERAGLFDVIEVKPADLRDRIQETVANGVSRFLIAGGDGSIRTAVEVAAGTDVEMAVLPAGTLNHFVKDHRLPTDLDEAARIASGPFTTTTDVGRVGEHLFHGTSSVGSYVSFMRTRERLEPRLGYRISSLLAFIWTFIRMPTITVEIEVEGERRIFRTPLLFVAVGERELQVPTLGGRIQDGKRGLHVMVVRGRRRARLFLVALDAFSNGVRKAARSPEFDAFMVHRCSITMRRRRVRISFDGEAQTVDVPLEYQFERDMLKLVVADPSLRESEKESDASR